MMIQKIVRVHFFKIFIFWPFLPPGYKKYDFCHEQFFVLLFGSLTHSKAPIVSKKYLSGLIFSQKSL